MRLPRRRWRRLRLYFVLIHTTIARRSTSRVSHLLVLRTFFCNKEKHLSMAALSPAALIRPMDPLMPLGSAKYGVSWSIAVDQTSTQWVDHWQLASRTCLPQYENAFQVRLQILCPNGRLSIECYRELGVRMPPLPTCTGRRA